MAEASASFAGQHVERRAASTPLLSVCIPQYNRTDFLIENLKSLSAQSFRGFEVCIADDSSDDGGMPRLLEALAMSGLPFAYRRSERNRRYDANLRAAIDLAQGDFAFLLGNDDCLADDSALEWIGREVVTLAGLGVALSNYADYATGVVGRRVVRPEVVAGPEPAARHFRDFSFVSGIVLRAGPAKALATDRWDGSEMYQMYLACRIIAAGASLATFERVLVRKDIQLVGQRVDSYRLRPRERPPLFTPVRLPLLQIPALVADALRPHAGGPREEAHLSWLVARQVLIFTFPFWLVEYRRVQSFRYAFGLWLGMRPSTVFEGLLLGWRRVPIWLLYLAAGLAGLLVPVGLFRRVQGKLHWLAKRSSLATAS